MKNTKQTIAIGRNSLYVIERTIWEDENGRYWIRNKGQLTEVFKVGNCFYYRHQLEKRDRGEKYWMYLW